MSDKLWKREGVQELAKTSAHVVDEQNVTVHSVVSADREVKEGGISPFPSEVGCGTGGNDPMSNKVLFTDCVAMSCLT